MRKKRSALVFACSLAAAAASGAAIADHDRDDSPYRHVLLISIDGMHSADLAACMHFGTCPTLAALAAHGVNYLQASASRPSDSFPGLTALVTGGTPRSTGAFYDVAYDRSLSPPAKTTPYGIPGGPGLCPSVVGTQIGFDEEIDADYTKLDAGGGINPDYLPRDPRHGCAPVYPHNFIRTNTVFEVVKSAGGYTAWSDKHLSYELVKGRSGFGVDDFYAPEINSVPVALPSVRLEACNPLPDQTAVGPSNAWTDSFANIRCYDSLKVQAILNEIAGRDHSGQHARPVPALFGMNFQAVSVGQKLAEKSIGVSGGYIDADATPTAALREEIAFVDRSIGRMAEALEQQGLRESTLIIVTAKHGQSAIDPHQLLRIPADAPSDLPPSAILSPNGVGRGFPVVQALEDDISVLWLANSTAAGAQAAATQLASQLHTIGADGGQIVYGRSLDLYFNDPAKDPRTPNLLVLPKVGVVYTGGTKKLSEHGGFGHDDTNVVMLVSGAHVAPGQVQTAVQTDQVAPTILRVLGLDPTRLDAVRNEGTPVLPSLHE